MEKITDKYHQPIPIDHKPPKPFFDIKEVPKRTFQLGLACLFTGIAISIYDAFLSLYVSSFLVACFCFSILMFMLLKYHDAIKDLTLSIISMVCALLICSACLEGLQSEEYLYFFPLLIAVPLIVDLKQTQYHKTFTFISIIIVCFLISIIIGKYVTPMENFTGQQMNRLALLNRVIAICSTIVFAALYTFFEKKYIEELVEQSNQVIDAKTQFMATMGHELRTPLNGIIGVVNLLKVERDPVRQEEYIHILKNCSDNMLKQVNDILDLNKIDAGKLKIHLVQLNLGKLLTTIVEPFIALSYEKNLEVKVEIDPELDSLVFADDLRLIQVFNNLLANALKFTNSGYVMLKAVCKARNDRRLTVSFSIEDTGIGIDKVYQEKIFERFWQVYDENTRQLTGSGLGLSICLRLLKLMGSTLNLESEKGKGSKFSFDLIFDYGRTQPIPLSKKVAVNNSLADTKILLVEDNSINMMVAKKILMGFGAEVGTAYDGKEALENMVTQPNYNMVLMDLEMPVMNGYTAIYEMKRLYPEIPVIALTASIVSDQMLADLLASGFNDCLLKPFQPKDLYAKIKKQLTPQAEV